MAITETSTIRENEDGDFTVPSQRVNEFQYTVRIIENKFICNCPDFTYRKILASMNTLLSSGLQPT